MAQSKHKSLKWIKKKLDQCTVTVQKIIPGETIIVMDTTYFGRGFGVMVFRCALRRMNLYWKFLSWETIAEYVAGVRHLEQQGWIVQGIVSDGRRGLLQAFPGIPTQMCQFHQMQIVTRYITRRPKLEAGKSLRNLILLLTKTDKESFCFWLEQWHTTWKTFLQEKVYDPEKKRNRYRHRKLRSAYNSLKTNLPYLFTFYDHPEISLPNTTNILDGHFSIIKEKTSIHRGVTRQRKKKIIDALLSLEQPHTKDH